MVLYLILYPYHGIVHFSLRHTLCIADNATGLSDRRRVSFECLCLMHHSHFPLNYVRRLKHETALTDVWDRYAKYCRVIALYHKTKKLRQFFFARGNFIKWKFWTAQFCLSVVCLFLFTCLCVCSFALFTLQFKSNLHQTSYTPIRGRTVYILEFICLDPDPGLFRSILQRCEVGHFATISLIILWTSWSDLHENFTTDVSLNKDTFDIFWNSTSTDPDPDFGHFVLIVRSTEIVLL